MLKPVVVPEVGSANAALPNSVSEAAVGVAVELGTASSKLASVVASAGVENVGVLLKSAKVAEAGLSSVAAVVHIVVEVVVVYVTVLRAWDMVQ